MEIWTMSDLQKPGWVADRWTSLSELRGVATSETFIEAKQSDERANLTKEIDPWMMKQPM
jgi:hypothetical protein